MLEPMPSRSLTSLSGGLLAVLCALTASPQSSRAEQPAPADEQVATDLPHPQASPDPGPSPEGTGREAPSRIFADSFIVWIYSRPERDPAPIGYLRAGQSAALRTGQVQTRRGCSGGWYEVRPAGSICADRHTSFRSTRYTEAMAELAPSAKPHLFSFALSMGTPAYRRVPSQAEWRRAERKFGSARPRPLPPHWRGHEELVGAAGPPEGPLPWFLEDGGSVARGPENRLVRREVPFGSMLALTSAFQSHGREFLVSADGTIVPADRMRPFRETSFEGVSIDADRTLPLAWPRKDTTLYSLPDQCRVSGAPAAPPGQLEARPARLSEGCLASSNQNARRREVVPLTGRRFEIARQRFLEATDGHLLLESQLFVAAASPSPASSQERWIQFSISQGTLVAYEGERPVFATLASPGIGGLPRAGGDSLSDRTTPLGTFRITFKHQSDDMSPEAGEHRSFWIADVPYAMYFKQPFAIHVAYWHESFGEPMSGGCINVSPRDGARLFSWTSPSLPEGWYGVGASRELGLGTLVRIER